MQPIPASRGTSASVGPPHPHTARARMTVRASRGCMPMSLRLPQADVNAVVDEEGSDALRTIVPMVTPSTRRGVDARLDGGSLTHVMAICTAEGAERGASGAAVVEGAEGSAFVEPSASAAGCCARAPWRRIRQRRLLGRRVAARLRLVAPRHAIGRLRRHERAPRRACGEDADGYFAGARFTTFLASSAGSLVRRHRYQQAIDRYGRIGRASWVIRSAVRCGRQAWMIAASPSVPLRAGERLPSPAR
jgi:hypothetical protein